MNQLIDNNKTRCKQTVQCYKVFFLCNIKFAIYSRLNTRNQFIFCYNCCYRVQNYIKIHLSPFLCCLFSAVDEKKIQQVPQQLCIVINFHRIIAKKQLFLVNFLAWQDLFCLIRTTI